MSEGICIHLNGSLCALQYCDYYDYDRQACSMALESKARVDIMMKVLDKVEELLADAKDEEAVMKVMKELNVMLGPKTLQ